LNEEQIRARVGEQSFVRGREYFESGAIFDGRRQGMTLKAQCAGTQAACGLLATVRELYQKVGENATWTTYINGLREANRRLRALKEELTRAGL
jgi:uncharacterized Zn finger protein